MLKADQAFYGKKWFAWYIYDTEKHWDPEHWNGYIQKKKWFTDNWLESRKNMYGCRFCYASEEKLKELWIKISRSIYFGS